MLEAAAADAAAGFVPPARPTPSLADVAETKRITRLTATPVSSIAAPVRYGSVVVAYRALHAANSDGGGGARGKVTTAEFDAVIVCTPGPTAVKLLEQDSTAVHPSVRAFASSQRYRASLHASFLVKASDLNKNKPPAATLVPAPLVPPLPAALDGCAPWVANAVASIVFPSGKLEAPSPPGAELVTVYLSAEASDALLPYLHPPAWVGAVGHTTELPQAPKLANVTNALPEWMRRQMDARQVRQGGLPSKAGRGPTSDDGLSSRKAAVAAFMWKLARFAAVGMVPTEYTHVVDVQAWLEGWADFPIAAPAPAGTGSSAANTDPNSGGGAKSATGGRSRTAGAATSTVSGPVSGQQLPCGGRYEACVDAVIEQRRSVARDGVRVLFAGDYMAGGTAEGAVRSASWAVDSLLKAVVSPGVLRAGPVGGAGRGGANDDVGDSDDGGGDEHDSSEDRDDDVRPGLRRRRR